MNEQEVADLSEALLGNPYRGAVRRKRRELETGMLKKDVSGWRQWWKDLPPAFLQKSLGLIPCLALGSSAPLEVRDERIEEVAHILPMEFRNDCMELSARSLEVKAALDRIVGDTEEMQRVRQEGWSAAFGTRLDLVHGLSALIQSTPVLVTGETGTGKELLAQALCRSMPGTWKEKRWKPAPSQTIHLASIPDTLVESVLFGHAKGAFTGASDNKDGVFKHCHNGVVFLDEVAELPPRTQVSLLRALQEGKVLPLGAPKEVDAAPRVVSATHQSLEKLLDEKTFREDLYYRLSSVVLTMPPLRERRSDIPLLAEEEIARVEPSQRGELKDRFIRFIEGIEDYAWPGNVRELAKVVRTLALGLKPQQRAASAKLARDGIPAEVQEGKWKIERVKSWYAAHVSALSRTQGEAANRLGVDRGTLRKLLGNHERES